MSHASYTAADVTRAARRWVEPAKHWPHWPRVRVRRLVAIELGVSTTALRYLLRRADTVLGTDDTPAADAAQLAA